MQVEAPHKAFVGKSDKTVYPFMADHMIGSLQAKAVFGYLPQGSELQSPARPAKVAVNPTLLGTYQYLRAMGAPRHRIAAQPCAASYGLES